MENIKFVDNSNGYSYGSEQILFDTERDHGNEYVKVYFRIDAKHCQYPFNTYDGYEDDRKKFKQETEQLFQTIGWNVADEKFPPVSCATVTDGKSHLYLHPQNFSGEVLKNDVKKIANLLSSATTFKLRYVDLYDTVYDITDQEYGEYLNTQIMQIKKRIFEACKTPRTNKFCIIDCIIRSVVSHVKLARLGLDDGKYTSTGYTCAYVERVIKQMADDQLLVIPDENLNLVRSVNKTEQKKLKLKLDF